MSSFTFQGKDVFYEVTGEGKPILLLNGIMMSTKSWGPFLNSFSNSNKLIRVDFLDQGQSTRLTGYYEHDIQVEVTHALVLHLKLESVSIIGISYGGEVALEYAIKYPEFVDRLVIFNTAAYTTPWLRDIGRSWIKAGGHLDGEAYYFTTIPIIYSPYFYENNQEWFSNRKKLLVPLFSNELFINQMERLTISSESYNVLDELNKVTAHTLIVSSEEDYLTPIRDQELLARKIKNSHWVKIPNAGHASMYEQPMIFASLCLGFINIKDTLFSI